MGLGEGRRGSGGEGRDGGHATKPHIAAPSYPQELDPPSESCAGRSVLRVILRRGAVTCVVAELLW